jgi:Bifunctional DNA primase/polymerase, N-terminal
MTDSPYALAGPTLVANGYSAIPIMPGTKRPGLADRGIGEWQRFCDRLPTKIETNLWCDRPGIGVGVALGAASGGLVAVDVDSDDPAVIAAVEGICASPVHKRGRKGHTAFFRASPSVKPRSFRFANGDGVDLLASGKQTVLPPTIHPDTGKPYAWLSVDTLEQVSPEHLPELPEDIADQLAVVLAQFGCASQPEPMVATHTAGGSCDDCWKETNEAALANLGAWVPALRIEAKREGVGWRAQAKWRNGDGYNVSFHPKGIRDFAAGVGYSAIDIVAKVANCEPHEAMRLLRDKLGLCDPEPVEFRLKMEGDAAAEPVVHGAISPDEDIEVQVDASRAEVFSEGVNRAQGLVTADVRRRHLIEAALTISHRLPAEREAGVNCDAKRIGGWIYFEMKRRAEINPAAVGATPEVGAHAESDPADGAVDIPRPMLDPFDPPVAGGLLQKTAQWIYETSFVPSGELSMLAAIGVMSAFVSRRYVGPTGLSPNLYLVGLATTTAGKDGPLSAAINLLTTAGMTHLLGSGDITSDKGFEKLVRRKPACLLPMDEIGSWLEEGSGRGAAPHAKARRKALLTLYTKSKQNSVYLGKDDAGPDVQASDNPVYMPCVSILGVSTLTTFFNGLKEENTADGLIGRMTVVRIPPSDQTSPQDFEQDTSVPVDLQRAYIDAMADWPVVGELAAINAKNPLMRPTVHKVPFADESARQAFRDIKTEERALIAVDQSFEGCVGRAAEQALKFAMIRAGSRDFATPAITADDVEFGRSFAWISAEMMREGMADYMAGSDFEDRCKTIMRAVKAAGRKGIAEYKLRRLAGVRKIEPRHYDEAIRFLTVYKRFEVKKGPHGSRYLPL